MLNCAFKRVTLCCVSIFLKKTEVKNVNIDFFYYYLLFIYFLFILRRIKIGKLAIP